MTPAAEGADFRSRLRALARALARGEKPARGERPAADRVLPLSEVWPARAEGGCWRATPPWPARYPKPRLGADIRPATAIDVESLGRTPKPLFLVGAAHIAADGVSFEQFVATHPQEEAAVLTAAARTLAAAPLVLSYNGLTFDLPLIRDRLSYWRLSWTPPRRHVDLLWLVRRAYKKRLGMPACGLADAERYILGVDRPGDDIFSSQVPALYERAVRAGDARPLVPILQHNLYDLAACVLIYVKASRENPQAFDVKASEEDAGEAALF